ncbi:MULTISPECIES: hypothetical protein [Roseinatronobacter]|uniref:Uncharacterized protein n=1 Tax=Roseinatronobacter domitianus TaxID=2940293 RepID=A0ABT0M238_9RHOB|nr:MULTISPECIES: hypothetical protein [Roseibaca]MCL1628673.1 hypothetical protein [Roseibaca domitiana]
MIVLHVVIALLFGLVGLVYGLMLGLSAGHLGVLYGLCGGLGLLLSITARMALAEMSDWARKPAQGG